MSQLKKEFILDDGYGLTYNIHLKYDQIFTNGVVGLILNTYYVKKYSELVDGNANYYLLLKGFLVTPHNKNLLEPIEIIFHGGNKLLAYNRIANYVQDEVEFLFSTSRGDLPMVKVGDAFLSRISNLTDVDKDFLFFNNEGTNKTNLIKQIKMNNKFDNSFSSNLPTIQIGVDFPTQLIKHLSHISNGGMSHGYAIKQLHVVGEQYPEIHVHGLVFNKKLNSNTFVAKFGVDLSKSNSENSPLYQVEEYCSMVENNDFYDITILELFNNRFKEVTPEEFNPNRPFVLFTDNSDRTIMDYIQDGLANNVKAINYLGEINNHLATRKQYLPIVQEKFNENGVYSLFKKLGFRPEYLPNTQIPTLRLSGINSKDKKFTLYVHELFFVFIIDDNAPQVYFVYDSWKGSTKELPSVIKYTDFLCNTASQLSIFAGKNVVHAKFVSDFSKIMKSSYFNVFH